MYLISEVCRFDMPPLVNQVCNQHPLISSMVIISNLVPQLWPVVTTVLSLTLEHIQLCKLYLSGRVTFIF